MYVHTTAPLFAWEALEDSPPLKTLRQFLMLAPDGKLLESLRVARGHSRDDYPPHVLWGVVLLTIALRHTGFEACLGELGRNRGLRELIGIESAPQAPKKWNLSRFLEVLGSEPHRTLLKEVFDALVGRLGLVVEDLGVHAAGDATALNARRKLFWGADDGNITGARRFHAFIGAVMVVPLGFATVLAATPRRHGPMGKMQLGPIPKALQQGLAPP